MDLPHPLPTTSNPLPLITFQRHEFFIQSHFTLEPPTPTPAMLLSKREVAKCFYTAQYAKTSRGR